MSGVTPGTTNLAALQADENSRDAGEVSFALDALEYFVNRVALLHDHALLSLVIRMVTMPCHHKRRQG